MSDASADPWGQPDNSAADAELEPTPSETSGLSGDGDNNLPSWPAPITCWRCGKEMEATQVVCRYCNARLVPEPATTAKRRRRGVSTPALRVVWLFVALLVVNLLYGWSHHFFLTPEPRAHQDALRKALTGMLAAELVDTILVGAVLLWIGRLPSQRPSARKIKLASWLAALPILLILLVLNFGYHWLLRQALPLVPSEQTLHPVRPSGVLVGWIVLAYCAQPAMVEELFARYLALGTLQQATGVHGAVLVSSVMFGMAHIGAPLSIPLFIGVGMALGYLRVASGSLLLPILMHFSHNAVITYIQLAS